MIRDAKKIFVGVSGGVDSSVAAALLQQQGYDVVGVFIKTWQPEWLPCTWREERRDAMRVCAHLKIPFLECDLEEVYKKGVADYMITEYKRGHTPNPDVMCNREVKFGAFLQWALSHGADAVATGHYAQNIHNEYIDQHELHRGADENKDQSYFLWTLTQDQLAHVFFPVGQLPKKKVRKLARRFGLPTSTKKDSQGICFLGEVDMKEFLKHYIDEKPGDVVDEKGHVIGSHEGAFLFTLGERHGFTITEKTNHDKPYYVVGKHIRKNTLVVSQTPETSKKTSRVVTLRDVNDYLDDLVIGKRYITQNRYHGKQRVCTIISHNEEMTTLQYEQPVFVASGQSVVLYDDDRIAGAGVAT